MAFAKYEGLEVAGLTKNRLQEECRKRGISGRGSKIVLAAQLVAYDKEVRRQEQEERDADGGGGVSPQQQGLDSSDSEGEEDDSSAAQTGGGGGAQSERDANQIQLSNLLNIPLPAGRPPLLHSPRPQQQQSDQTTQQGGAGPQQAAPLPNVFIPWGGYTGGFPSFPGPLFHQFPTLLGMGGFGPLQPPFLHPPPPP